MTLLTIQRYLRLLSKSIPESIVEVSVFFFFIGLFLFIAFKGVRLGLKYGLRLLLADYVLIMLCSTVIFRKTRAVAIYNFMPFRTYNEFLNGNTAFLLPQTIMNVIIFIPVGMLLKLSLTSWRWWQLLLIGCGLSLIIEISQLVLHRGFCEFDDVMHNGVGCLFGILLCSTCLKR